ncbi:putative membrane protein [Peptoniphilus sp. ING2-D1G]|nr:putative membrane protein [Peptoniphilus sp. ING2-D1G]
MSSVKRLENINIVIVGDLSIKILAKDKDIEFEVPKTIIEDFEIIDKNNLFYIFKKFFENNSMENFIIISPSTKFLSYEISIPKIKKEDIDSMVYYELEGLLPVDIDNYKTKYDYVESGQGYLVEVRLIEKKIIRDYIEIFERLNKNLLGIYSIRDVFKLKKDENIVFFGLSNICILNSDRVKLLYINEFKNLLEEFNLEYYSLLNILDGKYYEIADDIKLKVTEKSGIILYEKTILVANTLKKGTATFFGNALFDITRKYISEFVDTSAKRFDIGIRDIDFNEKFNFIEKKKQKNKNILYFFIIFLILNSFIYFYLNGILEDKEREVATLNKEHEDLQIQIENTNIEKLKEDNKLLLEKQKEEKAIKEKIKNNKNFENLFIELESFESDDLLFTSYDYRNGVLYINGISKSKKAVDDIIKKIDYESKIINNEIENNLLNFKIEVKVGE